MSAGARGRDAGEDAAWFLRERIVWPVEDAIEAVDPRALVGIFGGGGAAIVGVVALLLVVGFGGSGSGSRATETFAAAQPPASVTTLAPAAAPKKKATQPTASTLHGAPPDFYPAKDVKAGVGDGNAVERKQSGDGEAKAKQGVAGNAGEAPASTAKIGSNPAATASSAAPAAGLATPGASVAETGSGVGDEARPAGPPAPKAAKTVAHRFAEAFVVYETGGVDAAVRDAFDRTSTERLAKSLLHRPPRQPADVKVPRAKVVNIVAGPSEDGVYPVSVSLLRVGVTSELRLEMEQGRGKGRGKKWQVTNVLG